MTKEDAVKETSTEPLEERGDHEEIVSIDELYRITDIERIRRIKGLKT